MKLSQISINKLLDYIWFLERTRPKQYGGNSVNFQPKGDPDTIRLNRLSTK